MEKIRHSFYEYPSTPKSTSLKTETYPVRYPDRFYILPSTRVVFKPTTSIANSHESTENVSSSTSLTSQPKRIDDTAFTLTKAPIVVLAQTSTSCNTTLSNGTEAKPQLNSRSNKLATRKCRPRNTQRYMTQPITLIEIKEIEEDAIYNNSLNSDVIN